MTLAVYWPGHKDEHRDKMAVGVVIGTVGFRNRMAWFLREVCVLCWTTCGQTLKLLICVFRTCQKLDTVH